MNVRNLFAVACLTLTAILSAGPAMARPVSVPEPVTTSILGLGIGAAMLINLRKKK